MSKTKLVALTTIIAAFIVWNLFGRSVSAWIYLVLTRIGVPVAIVELILFVLPLILLWEIVVKFLLLQSMSPLKFISTQPELWKHLNQDELARYTSELEQLGFVQLTDYTILSLQGMARLFAHPQKFCFAEVRQVDTLPMFCIISCHLEKHWSLAVTNLSFNLTQSAISYAFFRQPHNLFKRYENASVNLLLQSLLDWRVQVCSDLGLAPIQDVTTETYFEKARCIEAVKEHLLLRKSIIWGLLEVMWFPINPKSEWLGDYQKFKVKQ